MNVLNNEELDLAVVHAGDPCQLAIVHAIGIPFVYVDLEGLSTETIVASSAPWPLPPLIKCQSLQHCLGIISQRLGLIIEFLLETIAQRFVFSHQRLNPDKLS